MAAVAMPALAAIALLIAVVVMAVLWRVQLSLRRPGLADAAWPLVTAALAVLYTNVADGAPARQSAIAWMIGSWGARLGVYLLWDEVFARPPDEHVRESLWSFERRALQAVLFSVPALIASFDREPELSFIELTAAGVWLLGFAGETTADRQFVRWRRARAAARQAESGGEPLIVEPACRAGVWRYVPRAHDAFELITWSAHALFAWPSPLGSLAMICPFVVAYRFATGGTRHAQF